MRAVEFLFEYRRDITAQKLGDQLITALANTPVHALPDNLSSHFHTIVSMALHPEKYKQGTSLKINTPAGPAVLNAETAPDLLQQFKPGIINTVLADIEAQDPTQNKEYSQWLARTWAASNGAEKIEDMNRGNALTAYTMGKRRKLIKPEHADINRFKRYSEFEDILLNNYSIEDLLRDPKKEQESKGHAKTVFDGPTVRIVVPEDEPAACYYGRGTRWCTAATRGSNYFDHYNRQGPLYILLPKKPQEEGEKYQLHFPTGQFMDPNDDPIDVVHLLSDRFPETMEFFKENEPEIANMVEFAPDDVLEGIGKLIGEYAQDLVWEELNEWESNDDYWHQWRTEEAEKRGYVDDDGDVDWDKVSEDDDLNDYMEFNDEARRFAKDVASVSRLNARQIKSYASDYHEVEPDEPVTIDKMDYLYSWILQEETGNDTLADNVAKNIFIRKNFAKGSNVKAANRALGTVGDWTVGVVSR